jgi:hypothetical protein
MQSFPHAGFENDGNLCGFPVPLIQKPRRRAVYAKLTAELCSER